MKISQCCPPGMQIKSPGGLSFNPAHVAAIESSGKAGGEYVTLHFVGGGSVTITFYRNIDGGPPEHYQLARNIEAAVEAINKPVCTSVPGEEK